MNQNLALRVLSEIMKWDDVRARDEFAWLRLMSRVKYDTYRDFVAGARFIESLADWLQQFNQEEREVAYRFVRQTLVFVGPLEMNHLVEHTYPERVQKRLLDDVANKLKIPAYMVWAQPETKNTYQDLLRRTLFLGLSDGARIDDFRRANAGVISNEQVVPWPQINTSKWQSLLEKLQTDTKDKHAQFKFVYLIDDFMGSGTTLLRKSNGSWEGKLVRFWKDTKEIANSHFDPNGILCVHHYIGSYDVSTKIQARLDGAVAALGDTVTLKHVEFSFGMVLPKNLPLDNARHGEFLRLVEKYYDPSIQTIHTELGGGGGDVRLGFGKCGLPLVLEHNTPNNSVALLWADTNGENGAHSMRPLFRRKQRHV